MVSVLRRKDVLDNGLKEKLLVYMEQRTCVRAHAKGQPQIYNGPRICQTIPGAQPTGANTHTGKSMVRTQSPAKPTKMKMGKIWERGKVSKRADWYLVLL